MSRNSAARSKDKMKNKGIRIVNLVAIMGFLFVLAVAARLVANEASSSGRANAINPGHSSLRRSLGQVAVGAICDRDTDCADVDAYCFLNVCSISDGNSYFYDQNAPDGGSGNSASSPLNGDLKDLLKSLKPGDTLTIVGELTNPSYNSSYSFGSIDDDHLWHGENTLQISKLNGEAGRPITIKGQHKGHLLKGDGNNIIRVMQSSYLRFYKLEVQGEVENIPFETAKALQLVYKDPNGTVHYRVDPSLSDEEIAALSDLPKLSGVKRPSYTDTRGFYASDCHHIVVEKCHLHHTPGNGLRVSYSEYVDLLDNEINHCSLKSYSGTMGVTPTYIQDQISNDPAGIYRLRVLRNNVHHNYNEIWSWNPTKTFIHTKIDEGKGISCERCNTWQNGGRALFAGNIVYWNGYSGLNCNDSSNLDFIGNTAYMNSYTASVWAVQQTGAKATGSRVGITMNDGVSHRMYNNIAVCDTDVQGICLGAFRDAAVEADSNMQFGIGSLPLKLDDSQAFSYANVATNQYVADPQFKDPDSDNFRLKWNSPALAVGNLTLSQLAPLDYYSTPRDLVAPDLGAIERS